MTQGTKRMTNAMVWESVRVGVWATAQGDTIKLVKPRGDTLYALRPVGSRRPTWHDSLREAKALCPTSI